MVKNLPANAKDARDAGSIPGLESQTQLTMHHTHTHPSIYLSIYLSIMLSARHWGVKVIQTTVPSRHVFTSYSRKQNIHSFIL